MAKQRGEHTLDDKLYQRFKSKPKKVSEEKASFDEAVAPILSGERGQRMATVRMSMGLTQTELGALLGVSQTVVSRIESGRLPYCNPDLTAAKLRAAVSTSAFQHILFGRFAKSYDAVSIKHKFMAEKNALKGNRLKGVESRPLSIESVREEANEIAKRLWRERTKVENS